MENENKSLPQEKPSDNIEMIKVHTPNFFERHFLHVLIIFGLGFLIFTYIFNIHFKPIYIVGTSMKPTINNSVDDRNIRDTSKSDLVYYQKHKNYNMGDIVLVDAKDYLPDQSDPIIKRIIATENNKVSLKFYKIERLTIESQNIVVYNCYYNLLINNNPLTELYINEQECYLTIRTDLDGNFVSGNHYVFLKNVYLALRTSSLVSPGKYILWATENSPVTYSYTVKQNEVFVCGDNRNHSTDSRYFGAVKKENILGSVSIHVPNGENLFVAIWKNLF